MPRRAFDLYEEDRVLHQRWDTLLDSDPHALSRRIPSPHADLYRWRDAPERETWLLLTRVAEDFWFRTADPIIMDLRPGKWYRMHHGVQQLFEEIKTYLLPVIFPPEVREVHCIGNGLAGSIVLLLAVWLQVRFPQLRVCAGARSPYPPAKEPDLVQLLNAVEVWIWGARPPIEQQTDPPWPPIDPSLWVPDCIQRNRTLISTTSLTRENSGMRARIFVRRASL